MPGLSGPAFAGRSRPFSLFLMTAQRNPWQLFGLDLRSAWRAFKFDWTELGRSRPFAWFAPRSAVRVLLLDGGDVSRTGCSAEPASAVPKRDALAIELPVDLVLERTIVLPDLPDADIDQVVLLEVQSSAPFADAELVWGWCRNPANEAGLHPTRVVLAARSHVERFLQEQAERLAGVVPEVWFDAQNPVLMRGFGETRRFARERRWLALNLFLGAVLLGILGAMALTPVLIEHNKNAVAQAAFAKVQQDTAGLVAQRDKVAHANDLLANIGTTVTKKPYAAVLLNTITNLLPDDVILDRLELRGDLVRLVGRAGEAAKLLQLLSAHSGFHSVRAPAAIARNAATGKETFVIEFNLGDAAAKKP